MKKKLLNKDLFLGFSQWPKKNPGRTFKNPQNWDLSQDLATLEAMLPEILKLTLLLDYF